MRHERRAETRIAGPRPREEGLRSESWPPADLRSPVAPSRRESVEGRKQGGRRRPNSVTAGDDESCPDGRCARNIVCGSRIQAGDKFGDRVADSHSLIVRPADDAMLAKVTAARTRPADHRGKRGRLLLDKCCIALRRRGSDRRSNSDDA